MRHRRLNRLYHFQGNVPSFQPLTLVRRNTKRTTALLLTVMMTVALAGCGLFGVFRTAVAASTPFVNRAVAAGKITQEKADAIKQDFKDIIDASEEWDRAFKVAVTRQDKADAFKVAANQYATIMGRGNFVNLPWLDEAVAVMNDIFDTIGMFYSDAPRVRAVGSPSNEAELKDYLEERSKWLKASFAK